MRKFVDGMFSTRAAGLYIVLFALAIGIATFIENDFGTSSAQKLIFRAKWFEILLVLFGISIVTNIFRYRMIKQRKWAILTFHIAVIFILIGAAITRYSGNEGFMNIREGKASNEFLSSETYLQFTALQNGETYRFDEKVLFASLGKNHFEETYLLGNEEVKVKLTDFIPNPLQEIINKQDGPPVLKLVVSGPAGREDHVLTQGDRINIYGTRINFGNPEVSEAINIYYRNDSLVFKSPLKLIQTEMTTQKKDTLVQGVYWPLLIRRLYSDGRFNFVVGDFRPSGQVTVKSSDQKLKHESIAAVRLKISAVDEHQDIVVYGRKGEVGRPNMVSLGNTQISVAYGSKPIILPFSLHLRDFIMERYPGTENASSYASEVTLNDPRNDLEKDTRIYMNNILNYGGYRFFQSSYDQDELGTVLSVNNDAWGTRISYFGYFLLTLGLVLSFFNRIGRFQVLSSRISQLRNSKKIVTACLVIFMQTLFSNGLIGQSNYQGPGVIDADHAYRFGRLIVQDYRGRLKPMNTLSNEVLRKVTRKETLFGQSADQIVLGMTLFPGEWTNTPIIKMGKHEEIKEILKTDESYVSYQAFFQDGQYKLHDYARQAHNMSPIDRGTFEKEIIKLDEKVNICNMVFSGRFLRLFPLEGDPNNRWLSPPDFAHVFSGNEVKQFAQNFYQVYASTVRESIQTGNWVPANELVSKLNVFQHNQGSQVLPDQKKVDAEIALNKAHVFSRLGQIYGLMALLFLTLFFISVFTKRSLKWPLKIATSLLTLCFLVHTASLGARWYVSGHAPWSNGFESMIYIAWTTMLAGILFSRRSPGGLAATSVLASTILMVAGLSWMDPEITPLVPVLKSYWLTIHVSLEAGSYGFLMLGAIIGVLNLILMVFTSSGNGNRHRTIQEMTYISEMTLIVGLVMLSIGTYLGGVWANESWGRYWGWDAKETWALLTILVYTFILHMRFIPGLRGLFAFNLASLFGFASVMMTYFGVNYYLSGLHSYATGDPAPIPNFVFYTVGILTVISLAAFWRDRRFKLVMQR